MNKRSAKEETLAELWGSPSAINRHHFHLYFIISKAGQSLSLSSSPIPLRLMKKSQKMKAMKGILLNKLQSIPQMAQQKQGRVLQLKSPHGFFFQSPKPQQSLGAQPEIMGATMLMRDAEEEGEDKENIEPASMPWKKQKTNDPGRKLSPFRRPELNSTSLFDPNLLVAFEQAVKDYMRIYQLLKQFEEKEEGLSEVQGTSSLRLLKEYEEKCPPGGRGAVIFYSTSIRGVRKTFEGCGAIRFLLESSRALFYERDVSMHKEYRDDLQRLLGFGAIPPRLFIDGKYIGGAEEVLGLHEQGRLMPILVEMPRDRSGGEACKSCDGARFLVCENCDGRQKAYDESGGVWGDCGLCNENGLVVCSLCCS